MKPSERLNALYRDFYQAGASEWRRLGALGKVENILSLCRDMAPSKVLDVGAGDGSVLETLSELNFGNELYAIELSPSGVQTIIGRRIPRLAQCQVFNGYAIPYPDDTFDLAIISHVVEHVEHPRQLLYEAARVAKFLLVEVPLEDTVRLPVNFQFDDVGHINSYSLKTMRRLLQSCDFDVLKEVVQNPPRAAYVYQKGFRGLFNYYIKQVLVTVAPRIATAIFTYHAAFLCRPARERHFVRARTQSEAV